MEEMKKDVPVIISMGIWLLDVLIMAAAMVNGRESMKRVKKTLFRGLFLRMLPESMAAVGIKRISMV